MDKRYTFTVSWSTEDGEYVALCTEFPSLSWLADDPIEALRGLIEEGLRGDLSHG